ncbi:MAG: GntR family transcriptional regulator [Bulleidia sp.]
MFLLNIQSKEPLFLQIQRQVLAFIKAGILKPGDRLPSVRNLAQDNGINPNTVARAYMQLEQKGYVYTIPKKGVFISAGENQEKADEIVDLLKTLQVRGFTKEQLQVAIDKVYEETGHAES